MIDHTKPLHTKEDAEGYIRALHYAGMGFHFDHPVAEIINGSTGKPLFTADECRHVENRVDELFALLDDPFELAVDLINGDAE